MKSLAQCHVARAAWAAKRHYPTVMLLTAKVAKEHEDKWCELSRPTDCRESGRLRRESCAEPDASAEFTPSGVEGPQHDKPTESAGRGRGRRSRGSG